MTKKLLNSLPEVFVSNSDITIAVSRAIRSGKLRKIATKLYTTNFTDSPAIIIRKNLWHIISGYFPNALIADRTALENAPAKDGSVCLITQKGRDIKIPGLILRPRRGIGALPSDLPFVNTLTVCSTARAYLENMRCSRNRDLSSRTLSQSAIEARLDKLIRISGEEAVQQLRDKVTEIAQELKMQAEGIRFGNLVGTLLGTRNEKLSSSIGKARKINNAYDPDRLDLLQKLHTTLRNMPPIHRLAKERTTTAKTSLAFFEAYFSNFIEGTEFEVREAADIVFAGIIPQERSEDAHDILGTWRIVSSDYQMGQVPKNYDEFEDLLKTRHMQIMEMRTDKYPGQFKQMNNRAGSTIFVSPNLVRGTLKIGFELYQSLENPLQKAIFMMFLISEIHPFSDGNGRIGRVMMNAELVAAEEERIIIPTIYRNNYLIALKTLSQTGQAEPLIAVLDYAQKWTSAIDWAAIEITQEQLTKANAFLDPSIADSEGIRLKMPS
jgi:fido (protein-threonine AMPylation protein)